MKDIRQLGANSPLIAAIGSDSVATHLQEGRFRVASYKKGTVLHFDGEPCSKLELILSGDVIVERIDEAGNLLTISEFRSGDILGGNLLFSRYPVYPMTISSITDTVILEIDRSTLLALLSTNPDFLLTYLEYVSDHAVILGDKLRHYTRSSIRESLMSFLSFESRRQNSRRVALGMSKRALAERLGVQRTSLSRQLAKMRDEGLVDFDRESITLL